MNKICLKLIALTIIFLFFISMGNVSKAAVWDDIVESGKNFLNTGKTGASAAKDATDTDVKLIIEDIYNIILPLGVGITVVVGGVLGIKFMISSVEEKAKLKESMMPYIIGCFAIYGALGIWKICIEILSSIF